MFTWKYEVSIFEILPTFLELLSRFKKVGEIFFSNSVDLSKYLQFTMSFWKAKQQWYISLLKTNERKLLVNLYFLFCSKVMEMRIQN